MNRIFMFAATNLAVLLLLSLVVCAVEAATGLRLGPGRATGLLAASALCGVGGALVSLALSKWTARRLMGVRRIDRPQDDTEAWLAATVRRLAARAGIATPEIGIFVSDDPNAFATGARRDAALIAVSTGLLRAMPRDRIEAVLGHEISHAANGDMVTLALLQGVLNTFVVFLARVVGSLVDRAVFGNDRGESGIGFIAVTLATQATLGMFAGMIVGWYARRREYRADRGGAMLCGADNMIGALELLKCGARPLPPRFQAFGIATVGSGTAMRYLMSHPPLEARIAALRTLKLGTPL